MKEDNNELTEDIAKETSAEEVPVVEYITDEEQEAEPAQTELTEEAPETEEPAQKAPTAEGSAQKAPTAQEAPAGARTAENGQTILSGGKADLERMRDALVLLDTKSKEAAEAAGKHAKAERETAAMEKKMQDTIAAVLKKRRDELANTFDDALGKDQARLRTIRGNREKAKTKGMKARMNSETSDLIQENKRIGESINSLFKQKGIPTFCNSKAYYLMYYPKGLRAKGLFLIIWLVGLIGIPWLITWLTGWPAWGKALLWVGLAVLEIALYVAVWEWTRGKNNGILTEMRAQRNTIDQNNRRIREIKNAIRRDPDESHYNLGNFDAEIAALEESIRQVVKKRESALEEFETTSRPVIVKEIQDQYTPKIEALRGQEAELGKQKTEQENVVKHMRAELMSRYGNYMGNEFMDVAKTEALIAIMDSGRANTVSEARNVYLQK